MILELFKNRIKEYIDGNIALSFGRKKPRTKKEKYWYNAALLDTIKDFENYKYVVDSKYDSIVKCLSENGIHVGYDAENNKHIIWKSIEYEIDK